jgi:hypothetical protein
MKHVVGDAHWHSPMACVLAVIISKLAVSEGLGSDPNIISFPTSLLASLRQQQEAQCWQVRYSKRKDKVTVKRCKNIY